MLGANLSIGNPALRRQSGGGSPPVEGMTITVGVVSEAPSVYAGYSDGTMVGATGACDGTLLGHSPAFVCTLDSVTDQMQIYITGNVTADFIGKNISVDGVPVFTSISMETNMQFNGNQTVILRNVPIDPADLWTNHIGEDFVFTID